MVRIISFCLLVATNQIVFAQLTANFTANKTSGCSPLTVQFTNISTGSPTSFLWRFGNGNTSVLQNITSATYTTPGTYTVTLIVSNGTGTDSLVKTNYITVFANPVASFNHAINAGCAPLAVQFNNTSVPGTGAITQYLWDFGDGNLSVAQSPLHTYNSSGSRTVTMAVTDINGCQHAVTSPAAINVTQTQTVSFTGNNLFACNPPLTSSFTSTVSPTGSYSYLWTTSNGLTSTLPNPQFTFTTAGSFDVTLKVTNGAGCIETIVQKKYVNILGIGAQFNQTKPTICLGDSAYFINTSTPDTAAASYIWKLNGITSSTNKQFAIPPMPVGPQQVSLTINLLGCSASVNKTITVKAKPSVSFTAIPNSFCAVPAKIIFNNTSATGNGFQYRWDFGNGFTSNNFVDSTLYNTLTDRTVILKVTDSAGCFDTTSLVIKAQQPLVNIDKQHAKSGCVPYNAFFTLMPGQAAQFNSFSWKYNNTVIGNSSSFTYQFTDTGKHVVTLRVTTPTGCMADLSDTVYTGIKIPVSFSFNKIDTCFGVGRRINFIGEENSGLGNLKYKWLWAGGGAEGKNALAFFQDTGLYDIRFSVDHNGCISDTMKPALVRLKPSLASFSAAISNCNSNSFTFYDLSKGSNKVRWFFGDGDSSALPQPTHSYASSGIYQAMLITIDTVFNCADTLGVDVVIPEPPVIKWTVADSIGCAPFITSFTNTSVLGSNGIVPVSTIWLINGKKTEDVNTVIDTFNQPGAIGVSLRLVDNRGCSYSLFKDTAVWIVKGIAKIGLSADKGCAPMTFSAVDSSQTDLPVVSRKWVWSTMDSTIVTTPNTTYTYATPSIIQDSGYTINLTITDAEGCQYKTARKILPTKPITNIALARKLSCGSQAIELETDTGAKVIFGKGFYTWDALGVIDTGAKAIKVFTNRDTSLNIRLNKTDANGCSTIHDTVIVIKNIPPQAGFYANRRVVNCFKPITPIQLFDTTQIGSTNIVKWEWQTSINASALQHPQLIFPIPGNYSVTLKVTDSAGCTDTRNIVDYFNIKGPKGSSQILSTKGCKPQTVTFVTNSSNAKYFIWDFADGRVDTVKTDTFFYLYSVPGTYYPKLTLVDSSGTCESTDTSLNVIVVHPLPEPSFATNDTLICANTVVRFDNFTPNPSAVKNWLWKINNRDTSNIQGPFSLLFKKPGKNTVTLVATDVNGCIDSLIKTDYIKVSDDTIPPAIPLSLHATVLNNTSNSFIFRQNIEPDFKAYHIYYNYFAGTPDSTLIVNIKLDTFFIQSNINPLTNPYSYSVAAIDACNNLSKPSVLHATTELTSTPVDNAIALKWTPYQGFNQIKAYEIWRNNPDSGSNYRLLASVNGQTLDFIDSTSMCFKTYFYRIKTIENNGNNQFSWSDTSGCTLKFVNNLEATRCINATVIENQFIHLTWQKRNYRFNFKYQVFRMRSDESTPSFYVETTDTFLIDKQVDVDNFSYAYQVYLVDECGAMSKASNLAKSIHLKAALEPNKTTGFDPVLQFNTYKDWENGVDKYRINLYQEPTLTTFNTIVTLNANDTQFVHTSFKVEGFDLCYQIMAIEKGGLEQISHSNISCISTQPTLFAPNAITVNNDGINERFEIKGLFLNEFRLRIYDRWGTLVFESNDIKQSWDGKINDKPAIAGVYTYLAEGRGRKNQPVTIKGTLTIIN